MIEYVEIRNAQLEIIGIIDTAASIIWHSVYYGVGDFEIYAQASQDHLNLLVEDNYVTRLNSDEIGVIEKVEITRNEHDGLMIVASGRFAKSILERRIIYNLSGKTNKATVLRGNVESAARALVANNATACTFNANRNISILQLGAHSGSTKIIVDGNGNATQKQVTNNNLMTYTDALLQEYQMSAKVVISSDEQKLEYKCWEGIDRSYNNAAGLDSVIFSAEYDNLSDSDYLSDASTLRNTALIGGEGEGLDRFYAIIESGSGLARRETFIDGSSISKKYKEEGDEEEHEYTDEVYKEMLESRGKLDLAQMIKVNSFTGTINTVSGMWEYGIDYTLGDIVTIQNNEIGIYANVRITDVTEVQDANGYSVALKYE